MGLWLVLSPVGAAAGGVAEASEDVEIAVLS
jgi:hypothetical protein